MSLTRVYVGPGGMLYVIVALLILGASIWTQANLLFWSFGLMIGGLLVSAILSLLVLRKVTVQRLLPGHGVAGEALVIRYRLVNRKRILPVFNIIIREHWGKGRRGWRRDGPIAESPQRLGGQPTGWVLHLGPNQTVQAEAMCWPLKRGMLKFERIEVSTSFPFGVLRKVIDVEQPDEVLIYPRLYRMSRRLLGRMSQIDMTGRKQLDRNGGMEEFFGLRPYRAGDSFKTIDWKHTAKTSNLVSREFTQPSPPKIMLLLDLTAAALHPADDEPWVEVDTTKRPVTGGSLIGSVGKPKTKTTTAIRPDPNDPVERTVSLAASLICDAYFYGYQVGMAVRGARCTTFPMHHSLPHRAKMLEALSTLDATEPAQMDLMPPTDPSVVIHCGHSKRGGDARCLLLGAADMEQYVREVEGGMMELLSRRVAPISRRDEMTMAAEDEK